MPIPRFADPHDAFVAVEPVLFCPACGWAVSKGAMTERWRKCRLCGKPLEDRLIRYPTVAKQRK